MIDQMKKVVAVYLVFFVTGIFCKPLNLFSIFEEYGDQEHDNKIQKRSPLDSGFISFHNVHNPDHKLDLHPPGNGNNVIGEAAALHREITTKPNPFRMIDQPDPNSHFRKIPDHVRELKNSPHLIYSLHRNHENIPPPRSMSKSRQNSANNKVTHTLSYYGHGRYPVVPKTFSQLDNEVDPQGEQFNPVVPVAHRFLITNAKKQEEHERLHHIHHHVKPTHHPKSDLDESGEIPYRDTLGGLGIGFTYGGQGAGHGFFAG